MRTQKRSIEFLLVVALLLMIVGTVLAQFPKIPKIPKVLPEKIPGVDKILKREPPVTTSISDAVTEVPFLDDFDPKELIPMTLLPRTPGGDFILEYPGLYLFKAQSYCLNAGTYAPDGGRGGEGYLFAPLKGPQADIVNKILRGSYGHPEIPQGDIQVLLWAIIARTKISDMSRKMQLTAAKLLTPEEIFKLNGGALSLVPEGMMDKAFEGVPSPVRRVLEAEARLRRMLTKGTTTYEELERVAVLHGVPPPEKGDREVPRGRWSYNPEGYFVRYFPRGYTRTQIQVYVPEVFQIKRDKKGRIILITDHYGNRIETDYDNSIESLAISGESSLKGYAFRLIRFERNDPDNPGKKLRIEWKNSGWTFCGVPTGKGKIGASPNRFPGLKARYEWAKAHKKQLDRLDKQFTPKGSIGDVIDLGHYTSGLKKVISGDHPEASKWVSHINLVQKAWQYEVSKREGGYKWGCAFPQGELYAMAGSIVPIVNILAIGNPRGKDGGVAQPGQGGRQRLGPSPRGNCDDIINACLEDAEGDLNITLDMIEGVYGVEIISRDQLKECFLHGTFTPVGGDEGLIPVVPIVPGPQKPINIRDCVEFMCFNFDDLSGEEQQEMIDEVLDCLFDWMSAVKECGKKCN